MAAANATIAIGQLVGREVGASAWIDMGQDRIDAWPSFCAPNALTESQAASRSGNRADTDSSRSGPGTNSTSR